METNNNDKNNHLLDINGLIPGLQKEDRRNVRVMRNFQWLMWILIPIYFGLLVVNPDKDLTWSYRAGGACYVLAFLAFALIFRVYIKEYKTVDYGLPTTVMLKKAIERYRLFHPKKLFVLIPVALVDAGLIFFSLNHDNADDSISILTSQIFYWGGMLLGASVGVWIWHRRQKPLRDAAIELLREIESD